MALRLIEMILPQEDKIVAYELLKEFKIISVWDEKSSENRLNMKLLVPAEETEAALDVLEKRFSAKDDFRILLLPVEASIPRPEPDLETAAKQDTIKPGEDSQTDVGRIHREELYTDIQDVTKFSKVYVVMVILSSFVAAIGILKNNVAIIIGAMVIAPLLGPNVALSLATTLGDTSLGRMALKTNIAGVLIVFVISAFLGIVIEFDAAIPEIVSRTKVGIGDVALALASGTAGALAFTSGLPSTVIGVMVAVAILPPLVTCGLLIGAGNELMAIGAMLLFFTNIICVNLAGVMTFLIQGIRPLTWWEATRAKRATRKAMMVWFSLLLALVVIILFSQRN